MKTGWKLCGSRRGSHECSRVLNLGQGTQLGPTRHLPGESRMSIPVGWSSSCRTGRSGKVRSLRNQRFFPSKISVGMFGRRFAVKRKRPALGLRPRLTSSGKWAEKNRHTVKALYLLRDTLKVVGSKSLSLAPATAGIFYMDMENPLTGGTGHTISLCSQNNVPVP